MSSVYLHIGLPKTGTSLQSFWRTNRSRLLAMGIDYPDYRDFPRVYNHIKNGSWVGVCYGRDDYGTCMKTLLRHCSRHSRVLLSEETLYEQNLRHPGMLKTLRERLGAHSHSLELIIYLRRQDEFFASLYGEQVKKWASTPIEQYLDELDYHMMGDYAEALAEIRAGRKQTHWIWYIFPQIKGLGMSATSRRYGIANLEEAKAYLADRTLRSRLLEISQALLDLP